MQMILNFLIGVWRLINTIATSRWNLSLIAVVSFWVCGFLTALLMSVGVINERWRNYYTTHEELIRKEIIANTNPGFIDTIELYDPQGEIIVSNTNNGETYYFNQNHVLLSNTDDPSSISNNNKE